MKQTPGYAYSPMLNMVVRPPKPNATHTLTSGQIVGERGGTAFPFRFFGGGNAVPLAYTTAVGGRGKRPSVVR